MYIISVILTYIKRATGYNLMFIEQHVNEFSAWGIRKVLKGEAPPQGLTPYPFKHTIFDRKGIPFT